MLAESPPPDVAVTMPRSQAQCALERWSFLAPRLREVALESGTPGRQIPVAGRQASNEMQVVGHNDGSNDIQRILAPDRHERSALPLNLLAIAEQQ